jgi:NADPH:quinone reductase-like Zn-dependent oxidoreductase
MRAVRIHAYGGPDQLQLEEASVPSPGAGEVLVQVRCAGVNPVDWKIRAGYMKSRHPAPFPLTIGQDFSGDVVESRAEDDAFPPGTAVLGFASGAYAEMVTAAADELAVMPGGLTYETAAALPTPGVTAYQIIHNAAQLTPGQRVLIHGGAGAVGSIAVQLAHRAGAHVAATAVNDADVRFLKELDVEAAINAHAEPFEQRVPHADAVIDLVGGETQRRSLAVLKPDGVLVSTVGIDPAIAAEVARLRLRTVAFVMTRSGADLSHLADIAGQGGLRVRIADVLPIDQAREAQQLSEQGGARGKVMLRVA